MPDAYVMSARVRITFAALKSNYTEFESAIVDGGVGGAADGLLLCVRDERLIRIALKHANEEQVRAAMQNTKRGTPLSRTMFAAHLARLAGQRVLATAA